MRPNERLLERINRNGWLLNQAAPRPLLTLEEFFEGNDEYGSIGCNLPSFPQPSDFYEVFRRLRERPDAADVRVQITSWEEPDRWPFSDAIWIITSLSPYDIQHQLGKALAADAMTVGWPQEDAMELVFVPEGMVPICVWWD